MIGENFQVLLQNLDPQLLRDVAKLYELEAAQEAALCEADRADIGAFNRENPATSRNGFGGLAHRLHVTDYWAQQVIHRAPNDPDLWPWFLKTPEGAYARVRAEQPARIVVPDWKGGLWKSVAGALA